MSAQLRAALTGLLAMVGVACREPDETSLLLDALRAAPPSTSAAAHSHGVNPRLLRRFEPLRAEFESAGVELTTARVALGKKLFFEKGLSKAGNVSCNSCHDLARSGADGEVSSLGTGGLRGARNSPTVLNAAGSFVQFWDGRAASPEEQALGPILNPLVMAQPDGERVVAALRQLPGYGADFRAAFPGEAEPLTFANVGAAIGAFERKLTTPSRWDDFLRGDARALSERELKGFNVFTGVGCVACHSGELLGGSMFQKMGLVEPWPNQKDQGRFELTGRESDRMVFKVPTLRNVTETAPYFHDGSVESLEQAVDMMAKHQLGLRLSPGEVEAVVAWLGTLTGKPPASLAAAPAP